MAKRMMAMDCPGLLARSKPSWTGEKAGWESPMGDDPVLWRRRRGLAGNARENQASVADAPAACLRAT